MEIEKLSLVGLVLHVEVGEIVEVGISDLHALITNESFLPFQGLNDPRQLRLEVIPLLSDRHQIRTKPLKLYSSEA